MTSRVLLVHFTPPGVIGGVEHVMERHIHLLQERGHIVEVVAGRPSSFPIPIHVLPEIEVASATGLELERELAAGQVTELFHRTRSRIMEMLQPLAEKFDVIFPHNAHTLHFSLPLTSVLWDLAGAGPPGKIVAWCHDLAWTNPLYIPLMHDGFPWDLLRSPAPNTRYVIVSQERKDELMDLWGGEVQPIEVIPNGIDAVEFLRLSDDTAAIVERYDLFECDAVLLLPVRITRRKNIEAAIQAVARLKARGLRVRFLISGPVAPHHPELSLAYLQRLKTLRDELGAHDEVVFLADDLGRRLNDRTVAELYTLADLLLFPSAQEGFGLPILEAGLARTPIVLSDIAIFREIGKGDAGYFDLKASPDTIADLILEALDTGPARLYRRVLRDYRWEVIADRQIVPLLTSASISTGRQDVAQ